MILNNLVINIHMFKINEFGKVDDQFITTVIDFSLVCNPFNRIKDST